MVYKKVGRGRASGGVGGGPPSPHLFIYHFIYHFIQSLRAFRQARNSFMLKKDEERVRKGSGRGQEVRMRSKKVRRRSG